MRYKLIFLLISLSLITLNSAGQGKADFHIFKKYPNYETIVEHFLKLHDVSTSKDEKFYQFRFARKPEGWFVIPEYYGENGLESKESVTIWSPETGYVIAPNYDSSEIRLPDQHAKILSNNNRYDFSIHPFYGYQGWDKDVISFFKRINTDLMSENELYGVSRAYNSIASNLFWSHSQYSVQDLIKATDSKRSDIRKYRRSAIKSIQLLEKLKLRNPEYKTLVGIVDLKRTNVIMSYWYELELFGYSKDAQKILKKSMPVYDDFWLHSSEYLLENLEEKAILFTNGDNDTYPHLWSQVERNIRNDIIIINTSLLNDPKYYSLICHRVNRSLPLLSGLNNEEILLFRDKYMIAANDTAIKQLSFSDEEENIKQQLISDEKRILIDYGYISIPYLNENIQPDTLKILNATKRLISNNQFFVTSILFYNIDTRPVYFIKSMPSDFSRMFNPETLLDEGMVIRLSNEAKNYSKFSNNFYDSEKVNNLLNNPPINFPDKNFPSQIRFYQLFLEMESREISQNINERGVQETENKILEYLGKYPPQTAGLSLHYFNLIYTLFQNESQKELARIFLKAYMVELENQIRETVLIDSDPDDSNHLKYLNYIISSILRSELEPGLPNFYEDLFMFQKSINMKLKQMPEVKIN